MPIRVRVLGLNGPLGEVSARGGESVEELKATIAQETAIPAEAQRLYHGTAELRIKDTLDPLELGSEVDLLLVQRSPEQAQWLREISELQSGSYGEWLEQAPQAAKEDREVCLALVGAEGRLLSQLPPQFRADPVVVLHAMKENRSALEFAAEDLWSDRSFVLPAVAQHGRALHYASPELRRDRDVVLAAVANNRAALRHADPALWKDREFVLRGYARDPLSLRHAAPELWSDREFALSVLAKDGLSLCNCASELRADTEVVLTAAAQNRQALQWASTKLLEDPDFLLATQDGRVPRQVSFPEMAPTDSQMTEQHGVTQAIFKAISAEKSDAGAQPRMSVSRPPMGSVGSRASQAPRGSFASGRGSALLAPLDRLLEKDVIKDVVCQKCSNVFMADSNFCRKCGTKRPSYSGRGSTSTAAS